MGDFYARYQFLIEPGMIMTILALSQFVVLKAGVFSVASVGLAAVASYTTAILQVDGGMNAWLSLLAGILLATAASLVLGVALSRLRGIFQAIATLSLVIVVQALILLFNDTTGGPSGINGIPQSLSTTSVVALYVAAVVFVAWVCRTRIGLAFEALRLDEIAAACHGVSVFRYQTVAFALSGALAGLAGGMIANYSFTVVPEQFSFQVVVTVLTFVVIGGISRVPGPVIGAAFIIVLPELVRPLQEQRLVVNGLLLILVSIYAPKGLYDTVVDYKRAMRARLTSPPQRPPDAHASIAVGEEVARS